MGFRNTSAVKQRRTTKAANKKSAQVQRHTRGQAKKPSPKGKTTRNVKQVPQLGFKPQEKRVSRTANATPRAAKKKTVAPKKDLLPRPSVRSTKRAKKPVG